MVEESKNLTAKVVLEEASNKKIVFNDFHKPAVI